ncbi:hypothetical protein CU254_26295 [Amycolatopsis sp. AA4]|uniref:hypothetical protein n=1 Tax=Actinomycetes TaxID=1760 RepID=UPI0001B550C4|nr:MULTISPECIES: hypothetical protein [Actinomycetes]ATY13546.1 hypothetical protein CU254_26295 [Amycolatopsis sp. AA4]EFL09512.1 predicted protein [Streptomyces sp. AA4]
MPSDEYEDIDNLVAEWQSLTRRLRYVAEQTRWLAARLTPPYGSDVSGNLLWIVKDFSRIAQVVEWKDFESLILRTTELHNRGTDILHPERGPEPVPSPFVRTMPAEQEETEAKRGGRQVRHVVAYESHIRQSLAHFVEAWTALVDGSLVCDWDMLDDEFPKLEILANEVDRAYAIWESISR